MFSYYDVITSRYRLASFESDFIVLVCLQKFKIKDVNNIFNYHHSLHNLPLY
jgi:hypothetical protein